VRRVADGQTLLLRVARSRLGLERARLKGLSRDEGLLRLRWKLREWRERVSQGRDALVSALERRPVAFAARIAVARRALEAFARAAELSRKSESVGRLRSLLAERSRRSFQRRQALLSDVSGRLEALSPLAILARGYAVAYREGVRAPLLSANAVHVGDRICVRLHEGQLKAVVREGGRSANLGPLFSGHGSERETGGPELDPEDG
jgi:exodeoxyribonuclease VII large subunit